MESSRAAEPDADLCARLRHVLREQAVRGWVITYNDLARLAAVEPPYRIHKVTLALEGLIREDHAAGRPLLAALAVSRARGGLPGQGFFDLLRELGRYNGPDHGPAAEACYSTELARALSYWGDEPRRAEENPQSTV